ncbi:MAG TPA: hypothetical protein DCX19_00095 [Alphaproteobacteria bacterium]|nr:hypothetical protein [Alphaproteobacteria bacterium]
MPEISVVIPAYNVDKVLCKRAVDSILSQTFRDFEVLVVDDTAADESEFYKSFGDDRLKYIHNDSRLGLAQSRNKAMSMASGKYIAFMDADDYSCPTRFQKQFDFMEQNRTVDVLGTFYTANGKKIRLPVADSDIRFRLVFYDGAILMPTVMARAETIRRYGLQFPDSPVEDYEFYLSAVAAATFANLPAVLLNKIDHANSISVQKGGKLIRDASFAAQRKWQERLIGAPFDWRHRRSFTVDDWTAYHRQVADLQTRFPDLNDKYKRRYFNKIFRYIVRHTVRETNFRRGLMKSDLPFWFKIDQFFKEQKK